MKKIIVGIFSFALLFAAQNAFAANWNGESSDCQNTIAIANYTSNTGYGSCWTSTSMSAEPGDTINVRIYYHNTSNVVAKNVRLAVTKSSNTSTSHNFMGRIMSDNGDVSGNVNLTISSPQSLEFVDARWFPNQSRSLSALPNGQSASSILSSGILIGDVAPGWESQGTMVAVFKVSNIVTPPPAQTCQDYNANNYGRTGDCTYTQTPSTYKITVKITGSGTVATTNSPLINSVATYNLNGSDYFKFNPDNGFHVESAFFDTTPIVPNYGYAVYNINANHEIRVTFIADQVVTPKTCSATLSANGSSTTTITSGQSATLSWTLADCTNATLYPSVGLVYSSGSQVVSPTSTMLYTLTAKDVNGATVTRTVTVNVTPVEPQTCTDPTASNWGKVGTCIPYGSYTVKLITIGNGKITTVNSPIVNFVATYKYPISSDFFGFVSDSGYHVESATLDGGSIAIGGYAMYNINANHEIRVTFAKDQVITPKTCAATLYASNISITKGESSTLTWTLTDCTNATLYPTIGAISSSNSQNVYPTSSTLYTLTGTGANGVSITRTVTVNVNTITPPIICMDYNANNYGGTGECTYTKIVNTILNTISNNTSTSTNNSVNNSNNNNSVNNSNNTTKTVNITTGGTTSTQTRCLDTSASNYYDYASCVYNNYNTTRCTDTSASNYYEYGTCIYNNQTRCLDTSASNYYGYGSCVYNNQTRCLDTSANNYNSYGTCTYVYVNKNVVTTVATNITTSGAQLNGYITNSDYYNSNTYFEYGTTVNLGQRTNTKTTIGNSNMNDFVSGLNPNTIYFFRAVGVTNTGTAYGNIEVFKTLGSTTSNINTSRTVYVQGATITGSASPIVLRIENRYQNIGVGDIIDYTVYYKNISNSTLTHPMVQVFIPQGITLINSSRGTYSESDKTLSVPIEDLVPNAEGVIYLQARVDTMDVNLAQIVTTAVLVYTNPNGAQENAMAYVLNNPKLVNTNLLGASAFFGNIFGLGLIGWLILIILILLLILIARSLYNQKRRNVVTTTTQKTISQ